MASISGLSFITKKIAGSLEVFSWRWKYQSGTTVQYGQVLIGNSSFRIGNTKFMLTGTGQATIANAVTDPVTGDTSLVQATAAQDK